ncbi:MAG: hypothetical protein M1358_19995 [Chloroflexi bacterium]|nr:hypothetical protein [Chloroflexota bacterium]
MEDSETSCKAAPHLKHEAAPGSFSAPQLEQLDSGLWESPGNSWPQLLQNTLPSRFAVPHDAQ